MRVGIIIDNPIRDLQGSILIGLELINLGIEAVLIPMYQQGTDVPLIRLDAIIVNYIRLNNIELIRFYKKMGIPLFVLDTEGGVLSENGADAPSNWAKWLQKNGVANLISGYFFWGRRLYDAFYKYSGIDTKKLYVTGSPRFDICSRRWRSLLKYKMQNFVLINTNFSAINPLYTVTAEAEKKMFAHSGWNRTYIEKLFNDLQCVFHRYLIEIERLISENPGNQFLIRPHPFENRSIYIKTFKKYENTTVDACGSIFNIINNANCVIHLNCGTSVEAILLEKVPISLEYLNTETLRLHSPLPSQLSYHVESFEHLNNVLRSIDDMSASFDFSGLYREYIQPWFNDVDGFAGKKIADILSKNLKTKPHNDKKILLKASLQNCRDNPNLLQLIQGCTNNLIGSKAGARLRNIIQPKRRLKYFDANDVSQILADFADGEGVEERIFPHHIRHPLTGLPLSTVCCKNH